APSGQGTISLVDQQGHEHPIADLKNFVIEIRSGTPQTPQIAGEITPAAPINLQIVNDGRLPEDKTGPFLVDVTRVTGVIKPEIQAGDGTAGLKVTVTINADRVEIRAKEDPSLVIAFKAAVSIISEFGGATKTTVDNLELIDPYPWKLI